MTSISTFPWTVTHDFAFAYGGAERVTEEFLRLLPEAGLTYFAGSPTIIERMGAADYARSLMPRGVTHENYRQLLPLYVARAAAAAPIAGNMLCSSYGLAHFIRNEGRKIVYCHSPLRQAWSGLDSYVAHMPPIAQAVWKFGAAPTYRALDLRHAQGADSYIATSRAVRDRLARYYGKTDIPIVAPPVDRSFFWDPAVEREDFYLWAGRIVEPYKRVGLLLEAFADGLGGNRRRLVIAGDGRDRERLEATAPLNVEFVGEQSTAALASLYRRTRALIMPSEDDFGMIATEAIACGAPVVAYGRGGALDSVDDGVSGTFFDEQTAASLSGALARFEATEWDSTMIALVGKAFSADRFASEISDLLGIDSGMTIDLTTPHPKARLPREATNQLARILSTLRMRVPEESAIPQTVVPN
jgi:glycosyltransferase involved in cell wall biosynthesis